MARRQAADQVFDEDGMSRMDDEGFSTPEPAATITPRIEARRAQLAAYAAEAQRAAEARRVSDANRVRDGRVAGGAVAAVLAGAMGVNALSGGKAPAPSEPPQQVPDAHTETQVGLPDDGPDLMPNGDPEDVSIDAPPPPARRLPPGYRAPQAARYQAPQEEELVLANPIRDDLVLPDPHAGGDLFLPDPNADMGLSLPDPNRARNPDDPRAKLSRLMKALGR
jgi:hypothetical protein